MAHSLESLAARLQYLEDHVAIYQLISRYGPAADAGASRDAASLWTEGGTYDAQVGAWTGRDAIAGMIEGEFHQSLIHEGCAHILTLPHIRIDGDRATAVCYGQLCRNDNGNFRVWRVTATYWKLVRTAHEGWRVEYRLNKVLDGDPEARELIARAWTV